MSQTALNSDPVRPRVVTYTNKSLNKIPHLQYLDQTTRDGLFEAAEVFPFIAGNRRPCEMDLQENAVYNLANQVFQQKSVDDRTFASVKADFGEQGVVELTATCSYFSLLGMQMNVAGTPLPDDWRSVITPFS